MSPSEYLPMAMRMRQQSGMNGQDIAGKFSGFGQSLSGAVTRMNGMVDANAGEPKWAEAGVHSGHEWADELMQSQGRASEHVAAHLGMSDLTSEREFKDIAHRRIVGQVFQKYQHDDQKLWNLYSGLNDEQRGRGR